MSKTWTSTTHPSGSIEVNMIRLADIELSRSPENLLVVIDVQGSELSVISGIDWNLSAFVRCH